MKYFIITKKHIQILIFTIILFIFMFIFINIAKYVMQKEFSPANILNEQLPEEDDISISRKILGFSKDSPESIFIAYSASFPEKNKDDTPVVNKTAEENLPTPTPQKIEEKSVNGKGEIKNQTGYNVNMNEFTLLKPKISQNPAVLIVHTHTTESYAPDGDNMYFINDNSRSTDERKNMIAIGDAISNVLTKEGIKVIHDKTFHDYPAYNGAYGRSLKTIEKNIKECPDIDVVIDVHRDAVISTEGTATKMVCDIAGKKIAQIMLVVGTDGGGLKHPNWRENLTFAANIQSRADTVYPGLMRPLNLRDERFNQHLTPNSIIVEVGTNANTMTEAKLGAEYVAECLANVIKSNS